VYTDKCCVYRDLLNLSIVGLSIKSATAENCKNTPIWVNWPYIGIFSTYYHESHQRRLYFTNKSKVSIERNICKLSCIENSLHVIWSNISNTRERVLPNSQTRRREMRIVFLTNFEVFENVIKYFISCLIYLLSRN